MDIAFIVGCARSGTSILGELVGIHPRVMYAYEEPIWRKLAETDNHAVSVDDISPHRRKKLREHMKHYKRKNKIVVEKNPRHVVRVPFVKSIFPEAKIIHIVRDGRDVSCSLKSGLCGKTWAHVRPPRWREIEQNYQGVVRCAHAYHDIMNIAIKDLKDIDHLQVKYEDLVVDPLKIARQIFNYIGLPLDEKVINFTKKIQNDMKDSYVARNQLRWYKEDHSVRMGRWKENMTEEEQNYVNELLSPILDYYEYSSEFIK